MTRLSQLAREYDLHYGTPLDDCPPSPPFRPLTCIDVKLVRNTPVVFAKCACGYKGAQHKTVEAAKADAAAHRATHATANDNRQGKEGGE